MDFTLVCADKRDIKAIFRLNKEIVREYGNVSANYFRKVMKIVSSGIKKHISEYKKIICGEETAGYLLVTEHPDNIEIEDLFLYSSFQNHGIGTSIIKNITSNSRKPVILYVFAKNEGAMRLYKRLGFEIVRTVRDEIHEMIFYNVSEKG